MRQVVIGLDAMEWTLVEKWAMEGTLPTFRRFIDSGTRALLKSTASSLPDTVWASLCTGANPGKLEKFFYVQYDQDTMGLRILEDNAVTLPCFWHYLSKSGVRVGVVDVPKVAIDASINGFQISNWGAHATRAPRASHPAHLISDIDSRFGRHRVGDCDNMDGSPKALQSLRERVVAGVRQHGALFRSLIEEQEWDVFFAAFSAPHCIGHHFWNGDGARHSAVVDGAIAEVYRAIDDEIGQIMGELSDDTRVMIVAAHGMGPVFHASWNLPQMLELWGYGATPARRVNEAEAPQQAHVNPWRILKMVVPGPLQYAIKGMLPKCLQDQLLFLWYRGGRTWDGCRAFAIPNNDSVGAIRVSVKGRDKHGQVEPGAEYQRVCGDIADALRELTDREGGRALVEKVTLTHEEFDGPFLDRLPDITVLWDQSFAWHTVYSPRFGTLQLRQQDARTGTHTPYGFALVMGAGIPSRVALNDCSIYDIAPTILQAAGVPIPDAFDGKALAV